MNLKLPDEEDRAKARFDSVFKLLVNGFLGDTESGNGSPALHQDVVLSLRMPIRDLEEVSWLIPPLQLRTLKSHLVLHPVNVLRLSDERRGAERV